MVVDSTIFRYIKMTIDANYAQKFQRLQEEFYNLMIEKDAKIDEIFSIAELECDDLAQLDTVLAAFR